MRTDFDTLNREPNRVKMQVLNQMFSLFTFSVLIYSLESFEIPGRHLSRTQFNFFYQSLLMDSAGLFFFTQRLFHVRKYWSSSLVIRVPFFFFLSGNKVSLKECF